MTVIHVDSDFSEEERRRRLYDGEVFVFTPRPTSVALTDFAKEMVEEAFGGRDPRRAQYDMKVEDYVDICAPLKPRFIHHPQSKQLIKDILVDLGCNLDATYQDVPRLRMVTSDGYLTSGVGYAHHPHRDTWYSAPMCQLNWWLSLYDFESENSLAFHPRYWSEPIENDSSTFDYYQWNSVGRKNAAKQIGKDTRKQPRPQKPVELYPQTRIVGKAGAIILFSGAQLHSTVPNTTGTARYSIDFRTIEINDVITRTGAPNIDSAPTGTSLRDFVRASDLSAMPEQVALSYDETPPPQDAMLVYRPA